MAIKAQGTLLKRGDGATPTEVFTTIAEVKDISGPGLSLDTADVTTHDSPGGWEEHIGTVLRSGEISFDIELDPALAGHTGLRSDMIARTARNFELLFPNTGATVWSFTAIVTGFEPSAPVGDDLTASVTLKLTGQPTFSA